MGDKPPSLGPGVTLPHDVRTSTDSVPASYVQPMLVLLRPHLVFLCGVVAFALVVLATSSTVADWAAAPAALALAINASLASLRVWLWRQTHRPMSQQ